MLSNGSRGGAWAVGILFNKPGVSLRTRHGTLSKNSKKACGDQDELLVTALY
jgi:hypothetical protein